MAQITVSYVLSHLGQQEAIKRGTSAAQRQQIAVDDPDHALLEQCSITTAGVAVLDLGDLYGPCAAWAVKEDGYESSVRYRVVSNNVLECDKPIVSLDDVAAVLQANAALKVRCQAEADAKNAERAPINTELRTAAQARYAQRQAEYAATIEATERLTDDELGALESLPIPTHTSETQHYAPGYTQRAKALLKRWETARETHRQAAALAKSEPKRAWIAEHGSDFLRKATAAGYGCQRRYIQERAALELGPQGWAPAPDYLEYRTRSCPSEPGLTLALSLPAEAKATVVWVTRWNQDPYDEVAPGEAIVATVAGREVWTASF